MFCCSVVLLVWLSLIGPLYIYLHVEILYCMFFFHRRYAMPFTPSLRLIGWLMALVCSHLRTFVLVTCMPLWHCACLMEEEGGVSV